MNLSQKCFLPKYYVIEPTNYCNYRCDICPNKLIDSKQKGYMTMSTFKNIVLQISNVAEVIQLYWLGEPLLHSDIFEMISFCKKNTKAKIMLSTNGSFLSEEVTQNLIKSNLDEIIISLDAYESQQIYSKIRTGGNLSFVKKNIDYFIKKNHKIHIIIQFIDMYLNESEKQQFINYWKNDKQCDFSIQCLYTWANQLPELNDMSSNLSPIRDSPRKPCADLWNKMCIKWNGDVSLCCFDWKGLYIFGNTNSKDLFSIWNCNDLQNLRNKHLQCDFTDIVLCKSCDSWATEDEYNSIYHL